MCGARTTRGFGAALWVLAAVMAVGGCSGEESGVLLLVQRGDVPAPEMLLVSWLEGDHFIFQRRRVPESGRLFPMGTTLARVFVDAPGTGERKVIVRGVSGEAIQSDAVARVTLVEGRQQVVLRLQPGQRLDGDGDDIPDEIDDSLAPPLAADAGTQDVAAPSPEDRPPVLALDATADQSRPPEPPMPRPPADAAAELTPPPVDAASKPRTLFVVLTTAPLPAMDSVLRAQLEALGHEVFPVTDSASRASDADGKALVVISSSVLASNVGAKFRSVTVPVITLETHLLADMGMSGGTLGTDFDCVAERQWTIVAPSNPLAAGLTGTVAVGNTADSSCWAVPGGAAMKVATLPGAADRFTLFAFEAGAPMTSGTAPARRVGWFSHNKIVETITPAGRSLFAAAVRWAAGG